MADAWRDEFVKQVETSVKHPLVEDGIDELLWNLREKRGGLVEYGIKKVAHYAAMVARCEALGVDIDQLRMTPEETAARMQHLIDAFEGAGKPVTIVITDGGA